MNIPICATYSAQNEKLMQITVTCITYTNVRCIKLDFHTFYSRAVWFHENSFIHIYVEVI